MKKDKSKGFFARRIMPMAKAVERNKLKAFCAMYGIWMIDLCSTAIALGMFGDTLTEGNPLAAAFFNFGLIGWLIWPIIVAVILASLLYLPDMFLKLNIWLSNGKIKKDKLKRMKSNYTFLRLVNVCFIFLGETIVILNNLNLLRKSF